MATFVYRARNAAGEEVRGTLLADSAQAAARMLDERELLPVEVEEQAARERSILTGRARRVSLSKIGQMYEQLADLLRAGVPILRALEVLAQQASSPALGRILREVRDDVSGGQTLADAMRRHPHAFPDLHAAMVHAGEKGGFLEDVLSRLSEFVARQDALKNRFVGALIYPCVLLVGALAAVTFIMTYVVPKIRAVLEGQSLPLPTRIVFGVSDLLQAYGLWLLLAIVVVGTGISLYLRSALGRELWSRLELRMIGLGKIYTMVAICRFCRVLGTMLANGIPILQSLKIAKDSTGNRILAEAIDEAAENVRAGEALARPLAASGVFPPAIVDMIAVAEESNTLDKVLVQIANTQEERTARQIDLTMRLLEPLLLLFMGVTIAFIAIALLVPILRMSTAAMR